MKYQSDPLDCSARAAVTKKPKRHRVYAPSDRTVGSIVPAAVENWVNSLEFDHVNKLIIENKSWWNVYSSNEGESASKVKPKTRKYSFCPAWQKPRREKISSTIIKNIFVIRIES